MGRQLCSYSERQSPFKVPFGVWEGRGKRKWDNNEACKMHGGSEAFPGYCFISCSIPFLCEKKYQAVMQVYIELLAVTISQEPTPLSNMSFTGQAFPLFHEYEIPRCLLVPCLTATRETMHQILRHRVRLLILLLHLCSRDYLVEAWCRTTEVWNLERFAVKVYTHS